MVKKRTLPRFMQAARNCSMPLSKIFVFVMSSLIVVANCAITAAATSADQQKLADRVKELAGQVTLDSAGQIIAIDLDNRPTTDDDLRLLAAAPNLQKLIVWGAGITDAG